MVVLLGGAIASLVLIVLGIEGGFSRVIAIGREAGKFHMFNWTWDATMESVWVVVIGSLFIHLVPYTADQAVVQRYLTTKDEGRRRARSGRAPSSPPPPPFYSSVWAPRSSPSTGNTRPS